MFLHNTKMLIDIEKNKLDNQYNRLADFFDRTNANECLESITDLQKLLGSLTEKIITKYNEII